MKTILKSLILCSIALFYSCEETAKESCRSNFFVPNKIDMPKEAGNDMIVAIAASADVSWNVTLPSETGNWITFSTMSGKGNGIITFNLLVNNDPKMRSVALTVTASSDCSSESIPPQECLITQLGVDPVLEITPDNAVNVPATASANYVVAVTSNVAWSASVEITSGNAGWLSVAAPTAPFTGIGEVKLNITANNEAERERVAVLHVKSIDYPELNKTLTITQRSLNAPYSIVIPGYATLTTGTATMSVSPYPSGTAQNINVNVVTDASGATVNFTDRLTVGKYLVNSIGSANLGALIIIDEDGEVTFVEYWDTHLNLFGGSFEERPLTIAAPASLATLRDAVNGGKNYAGLFIKQTAAISLSDEWEPIGNASANPFSGIYDGNNQNINNLNISSGVGMALFGFVGGTGTDQVATIRNLTVASGSVTGNAVDGIAGIVANVSANSLIENCTNRADITCTGANNIGGIVGYCLGDNINVTGCKNYGKISGRNGSNGGIVGQAKTTATENIYMTSCHNYGDVEGIAHGAVAGIVGRTEIPTRVVIKWCSNRGSLTNTDSDSGTAGIAGTFFGTCEIQECFNLGTISGHRSTGGIAGQMNQGPPGNNIRIINCYNRGTIIINRRDQPNNAGIAANQTNHYQIPVEFCYNAGETNPNPVASDRYGAIASANNLGDAGISRMTAVKECFYQTGLGFLGGLGGNIQPGDIAGRTEGKTEVEMKTATPYTSNWNTNIWQFTAGQYPTLKNNPE